MYNPNDDGPVSPMKKLKILSEKQNVQRSNDTILSQLQPIKESKKVVDETEPLLQESSNQYVIFPINHHDMWGMYKELVGNFWSVTETLEQIDNLSLTYDETMFMKYFSSIFASPHSRGLVNDNFAEEFCKLIQVTEAKFFYGHQLFVQNIHYEMYNKLFDKFVPEKDEKDKMIKIVENFDAVSNKRKWISQWTTSSFGEQLIASACLHGLLFSSLELVHSWLRNRNKASSSHELTDILEKMIFEQDLQRDFDCLMISHLRAKPSKERVLDIINQSAKIEFNFLINGLKSELAEIGPEEIILLIDRKTKALKLKLFNVFDDKKKILSEAENKKANEENTQIYKENHQKISFDDDF